MVVRVPEPAIIGKAMGIMLPVLAFGSFFKISMPNIISNPIIKITIEPAMANDCKSTPNKPKNCSPINRNTIMSDPAAMVALPESKCFCLFLMLIIMGKEPMMSIIANRVKEMVVISFIENIWQR
jgi:hypothetical protein